MPVISVSDLSPAIAAIVTLALNSAECVRLVSFIFCSIFSPIDHQKVADFPLTGLYKLPEPPSLLFVFLYYNIKYVSEIGFFLFTS